MVVRGDEILFGCDRNSRKAQNLRHDPSVVLSIEDDVRNAQGFQRHLVVRGHATLEDGPNPALMDQLSMKYTGLHDVTAHATRRSVVGDGQGCHRPDQRRRPLGRTGVIGRSPTSCRECNNVPPMVGSMINDRRSRRSCRARTSPRFSTLLPSGQIQTHVVWVDCDDDHIVINTEVALRKFKNVQADPRVTVTVWDGKNP